MCDFANPDLARSMEEDSEEKPSPYYKNVQLMMNDWYKGKDAVCIDGIIATMADYRSLATEWKGTTIKLIEMEPRVEHVRELARWDGKMIELNLCGHEKYNLAMFIENTNEWNGETLSIGYSGPEIFTEQVAKAFNQPKYKKIRFKNCRLPENFFQQIKESAPGLECEVVDE